MLHFLPGPLRAALALVLYTINTVSFFIIMLPLILLKVIIFHEGAKNFITMLLMHLGSGWVTLNSLLLRLTQRIEIKVESEDNDGLDSFSTRSSYLVMSNHRSWADILILQHIFNRRIPFLKFFLKKELIWVPLLGVAWWALDFPFMKRYPKEYLEKHPELKGKDIETTRIYCQKFKYTPISVINFLEGTRFDYKKRENQKSPFRHLLKPRAGGTGIVLSSMGEHLTKIIDVTLVYPKNKPPMSFWAFLKGKIPLVVVNLRSFPIPEKYAGKNYETDDIFKKDFQDWINRIWMDKDETIEGIVKRYER
jgi:1-acyl-sn-glycerol-3-phosphate acyltransferase